jgi:SAM-dependent methyltransferase
MGRKGYGDLVPPAPEVLPVLAPKLPMCGLVQYLGSTCGWQIAHDQRMPPDDCRGRCCDQDWDGLFDDAEATQDLDEWHRNGPAAATADLIGAIEAQGVEGGTVLDIGAGVGILHVELLEGGMSSAIDVDLSSAFLAAARAEAARRGLVDRIEYRYGDAVEVVPGLPMIDLVTMDRVICCYPDLAPLLGAAAGRATRLIGLVHPNDAWFVRGSTAIFNFVSRLFRRHHQIYVHRHRQIDGILAASGFAAIHRGGTWFWRTGLYRRA